MEAKEEFDVDHLNTDTGTSFSQLLFGYDNGVVGVGLAVDQTQNNQLSYSPVFSSIQNPPKMLCFGNYHNERDLLFSETNATPQKSAITSSDSSSASSCNHSGSSFNSLSKSNNILQKKRNGSGQEPVTDSVIRATVGNQRPPKKTKAEKPTSTGHAKRKEKLGERIAALQQLVSPFGKTDTASVLHEAMGYIRFLHDQVQVLCSPYLQHKHLGEADSNNNKGEEEKKDLRSKGLCLIPVGCTVHVASTNGADFWSPATMGSNVSTSAKH